MSCSSYNEIPGTTGVIIWATKFVTSPTAVSPFVSPNLVVTFQTENTVARRFISVLPKDPKYCIPIASG